jgi:hypothetical protein
MGKLTSSGLIVSRFSLPVPLDFAGLKFPKVRTS